MNINLKIETADEITSANLIQLRDYFEEDLKRDKPFVFHKDPVKDKKKIKKYVKAFNLVIDYLKEP